MQLKQRYSDENREVIERYLQTGGEEAVLNELQQKLLERWRYADELIRKNVYKREEITNRIISKFGVSRDTAFRDIVNAEFVFSSSAPLNKKYLIGLRIEYLQQLQKNLLYHKNDKGEVEMVNDAEIYEVIARIEIVIQKYIDKYPDFTPPRSPKNINYIIQNNNLNVTSITVEQANENFDKVLKQLEDNDDY